MKFSSVPGFVFAEDRVDVEAKDRTACLETRLMLLARRERTAAMGPDIVNNVATVDRVIFRKNRSCCSSGKSKWC